MLPVIFRHIAEEELDDAFRWYEGCETGLGKEFMRCVDARIQLIRRYPEIFPVVHRDIRQAVVRRFPYSVFYMPTKDAIHVLSIFHASREPKQWLRPR